MQIKRAHRSAIRGHEGILLSAVAACVLLRGVAAAQGLTGVLIGAVSDAQGAAIPGAVVRLGSPAMIGGPATLITNEKGQLRFLSFLRTVRPGHRDAGVCDLARNRTS